jgi:hypothetical protein
MRNHHRERGENTKYNKDKQKEVWTYEDGDARKNRANSAEDVHVGGPMTFLWRKTDARKNITRQGLRRRGEKITINTNRLNETD